MKHTRKQRVTSKSLLGEEEEKKKRVGNSSMAFPYSVCLRTLGRGLVL